MSTVSVTSSSPSPAASPRHPFQATSSRHSCRQANIRSTAPGPRPSASSPRPSSHAHNTSPRQSRQQFHSSERDAPHPRPVKYVDSGTQYSPECYPPTAHSTAGTLSRKRKEAATTGPAPDPMTGVTLSSTTGTRAVYDTQEQAAKYEPPSAPDSGAAPSSSKNDSPVEEARSTHEHPAASKRSRPDPATWKVMPMKYELCSPKDLGALISNMLMELIRINDKIPLRDGRLTRFHSRAPPGISVSDYLQRLIQHATLSPPILLSMVYYIDRLCTMYPAFTINSLTVHRFLITAATVAAKGLSDSFWTNPTYARIGGIPVPELATLELELLQKVQWKIVPKPEALEDYYYSLVDRTDGYTLEEVASESESGRSGGEAAASTAGEKELDVDKDGDASMDDGPT